LFTPCEVNKARRGIYGAAPVGDAFNVPHSAAVAGTAAAHFNE
jgi:hypothetical protein